MLSWGTVIWSAKVAIPLLRFVCLPLQHEIRPIPLLCRITDSKPRFRPYHSSALHTVSLTVSSASNWKAKWFEQIMMAGTSHRCASPGPSQYIECVEHGNRVSSTHSQRVRRGHLCCRPSSLSDPLQRRNPAADRATFSPTSYQKYPLLRQVHNSHGADHWRGKYAVLYTITILWHSCLSGKYV